MPERGVRRVATEVEYTSLGRAGERELRGIVERRELRLGPLRVGRARVRAVDVYEPGLGHRSVAVPTPADPYVRVLRWTLILLATTWLAGALARRRHTQSEYTREMRWSHRKH